LNPKRSPFHKENWPEPCNAHDSDMCCSECHPAMWSPSREDSILYSTECLTMKIKTAKKAYYAGKPTLRDEEFDAIEGSLKAINPMAVVLDVVGTGLDRQGDLSG